MSRLFRAYGEFCATHPWEVIVTFTAAFTCLLTLEQHQQQLPNDPAGFPRRIFTPKSCPGCYEEQFRAVDVVLMTTIRCLAVLYSTHQLRRLHRLGCKYLLIIGALFAAASSFVFTITVLGVLKAELIDLKDALVFFVLLVDLSKAATLAQFALAATTREQISSNIGRGVATLGPALTLDTCVETLVIGVGTLSGVARLETLSYYACLSALVNYVILMSFYPACLSLVLELSRTNRHIIEDDQSKHHLLDEHHDKSNPAVQRVKLIMATGLMFVHLYSRLYLIDPPHPYQNTHDPSTINNGLEQVLSGSDEKQQSPLLFFTYFLNQIVQSLDHIVIFILLTTLVVKFVFFENDSSTACFNNGSTLDGCNPITNTNICEKSVQTLSADHLHFEYGRKHCRQLEDCLEIYRNADLGAAHLTDAEIRLLIDTKHLPAYNLEVLLGNCERGVRIRRQLVEDTLGPKDCFLNIPYKGYAYDKVLRACCENVIGYIPLPLGVVGPLLVDHNTYFVPMSTTEGCLIASTNRGCRALNATGVKTRLVADGMTRAPIVRFPSMARATDLKQWLDHADNFAAVKREFDATSGFVRLRRISTAIAARYLFVRFVAQTGDAMGMNMISKGTERALQYLQQHDFADMEVVSISGNYCTDKKPAAINWIEGRGKSVVGEAVIPAVNVRDVLKTSSRQMVDVNVNKNLVGSAMAGALGGFNAHAANIVTAIFLATGQDPAQNIASSNCITIMEEWGEGGEDLYVACTLPSLEIGTVGGGTGLPAQASCLQMLGVRGAAPDAPGTNARQLARIICGAVVAGEVSLVAALATGQLVSSHLTYNRARKKNEKFI